MGGVETFEERLTAQAQRLRESGMLGRSDVLIRLFDFLVAQTLAGRSPKEIEIAQDVFEKHGEFDVMLDASVRVYIHRLRKKIDDFYAADRSGSERLFIPKGEYRLVLATSVPTDAMTDDATSLQHRGRWAWLNTRRGIALAIAMMVATNLATWAVVTHASNSGKLAEAARSAFWAPLRTNGRPTVLVTGDYYIFGEASKSTEIARLVREFSINSKDDLDQYLMAHPDEMGRYVDVGLHYLPTSIPQALRDILPIVARTTGGAEGQELLISASELTPDMLKKANIVYLGYLSGLGTLRDPVFQVSGFQVGSSYDELIDRRTGKRYMSDQGGAASGRRPHRDYSYIASMPGPTGTQVLIVGGTRDAAVRQAAEIASDPEQLDVIAKNVGNATAFEALYEVRTLDGLNLGSKLVVARSMDINRLWTIDLNRPRQFPDQAPPPR